MNETHLTTKRPRKNAKLERDPCNGALDAKEVQGSTGARFFVRVTSIRKRLIDPDNICEKYHVDLCRYAGAIPNDSAAEIILETGQRKAGKAESEQTLIEIYETNFRC